MDSACAGCMGEVRAFLYEKMQKYINLEKKVQELEIKINVLNSQATDVLRKVKRAEMNEGKERKTEVAEWLERVEKKKIDFMTLKEQAQQASYISCSRIQLAERADTMMAEIEGLTKQHESFVELLFDADKAKVVPLVETEWRGPSFERHLQEIWASLMKENTTIVGVYGIGGVGKTTLAKFIHNDLLHETAFSRQVYRVTASKEARVLRNDIAKAINLDFPLARDELQRAAILLDALKRMGKFVILVDDVWTPFDVKEIGIPLQGNKIIVISRSVETCRKMGCQMHIKVTPLFQEEAWELFKWKLGRDEELPSDVKEIAESMAEKCAGFPLAIATVAASMKGADDIYEWRDALDELEQFSIGEVGAVFRFLECSYNRLRDQQLKDCFLCCSLYPKGYAIQRDELIMLFISEGLIEKRSRQAEFDRGHTILNKLESVCLLEGGGDDGIGMYVKMHDLIRGMALMIAKSRKPKYMVKAGIRLKDIPEEREWKEDLDKVSLMHNNIQLIRSGISPECPKTLILHNSVLSSISDSFFAHLGELQNLDLSYNSYLETLPDCILDMKNLKALFLQSCLSLRVVPPLGNLEALIELNLRGTPIEKVPKCLERLVKLRSLNMDYTRLSYIPRGILSKLCSLRNLRLPRSVKVRTEELEVLKDLEEFKISFGDVDNLNQFVRSFQNHVGLNFYTIRVEPPPDTDTINNRILNDGYRMIGRMVELVGLGLGRGKSEVLLPEDVKHLSIYHCYTLSGCVSDSLSELILIQSRGLTECRIENFKGIKWILKLISSFNSSFSSSANQVGGGEIVVEEDEGQIVISPRAPLQWLESLVLTQLPDLLGLLKWESAIVDATLPPPTFSCLKTLEISYCPKVTKLFTTKLLLRHLKNLEEIQVSDCEGVEEIIAAQNEETSGFDQYSELPQTNTTIIQISLPKLKYLNLQHLPKLRSIYKGTLICDSLETIFIRGCSNLKRMPIFLPTINGQLSPPPTLREIQFPEEEQQWWDSLEWDNSQSHHVIQPFVRQEHEGIEDLADPETVDYSHDPCNEESGDYF